MNVVERSKYRDEDDTISFMNRVNATLEHGLNWYGIMQSQEVVTRRLGRVLGDQHHLLRNISIPGIEEGMPLMVMVNPQGVRLLMTYSTRGVFRAKDDDWLRFESRTRKFKRSKPNLQTEGVSLLKRLQQLLEIQGHENFESEVVLIFTHPRTLIDSARPITRVVSADAIEYFAANLEQSDISINPDRVNAIVDALLYPQIPDPELAAELLAELEPEQPIPSLDLEEPGIDLDTPESAETVQRLESFFQSETQDDQFQAPDPQLEPFTQPSTEPEMEHTPAFYPESMENFDRESSMDYADQLPTYAPEDSFTPQEDLYARPQYSSTAPDSNVAADSFEPAFQETRKRKRSSISMGQWLLLGVMAVVEFSILIYFAYIILTDLGIL
jgi:hypothetical protein